MSCLFRTMVAHLARLSVLWEDHRSVCESISESPASYTSRCEYPGDIRSRLVRLIPSAPAGSSLDAIRNLLEHRISAKLTDVEARVQWREIVEGRHSIWTNIPNDRKESIRGQLPPMSDCVARPLDYFYRLSGLLRVRGSATRTQELFLCERQVRLPYIVACTFK